MSPSSRSQARSALLVLGGAGVVAMAWVGLVQILRASPFAKFVANGTPIGAEVGVTLSDFSLRAYEKDRLAAEARVDKVEVRRDRSQMAMSTVREGRFFSSDGDSFAFDMKGGTYHYFQNRLTAEHGAHVKNDDMDLESDRFTYDERSKTLLVRGRVQGDLAEGAVMADDFILDTSTKAMSARNFRWVGTVEETPQEAQRKQWDIKGDDWKSSEDGKTQTYTNARATDGEVIVVAESVEYTKGTDTLVAKGKVKYWGTDANVLCDEATVYRKERRAVMTGTVRMLVKSEDDEKVVESEIPTIDRATPESLKTNPQGATQEQLDVLRDSDNVRKFPVKVVADRVEYWYRKGERRAVITGSPFARQDLTEGWRLAWSVEAYYDGEKETLTLKSNPGQQDVRLVLSIGDQFVALDVTLSTKEGDKSMNGHQVRGSMFIDEDEVPKKSGGGSTGGGR